jgi:cadherin 7, type 2
LKALRPQNTDVGDFINNKLREIDNDPVQPPYDSLQEYAYEGEGSMYGSNLSSLDMKFEETANNNKNHNNNNKPNKKDIDCDSDLECIKDWGPKFNKISDIYGLNSENEQEEDEDEEKQ